MKNQFNFAVFSYNKVTKIVFFNVTKLTKTNFLFDIKFTKKIKLKVNYVGNFIFFVGLILEKMTDHQFEL